MSKKINRIYIVGIDALEHSLVEKWNLKNLKQEEYGKVKLPISSKHEGPFTPEMWASFITGKTPDEHGIHSYKKWSNPIIRFLKPIYFDHIRPILKFLHLPLPKGSHLKKAGFSYKTYGKEDLNCETIFDMIPKSKAISVASYNEGTEAVDIIRKYFSEDEDKINRKKVDKESREVFEKRKKEFLNSIKKDYRLLMVYFHAPDTLQHVFYYDEKYIRDLYEELDKMVGKVKNMIDKDDLLIVISDHGQLNGKHTNYAFYSLNKKLNIENPNLTDFFSLIKKQFGIPSKEEEKEIKKHLEELGYFS